MTTCKKRAVGAAFCRILATTAPTPLSLKTRKNEPGKFSWRCRAGVTRYRHTAPATRASEAEIASLKKGQPSANRGINIAGDEVVEQPVS